METVGIPLEIFEKAGNSIIEHQNFTTRNNQLWQKFSNQPTSIAGEEYLKLLNEVKEFYETVATLHGDAKNSANVSAALRERLVVEKSAFETAKKYHEQQSISFLRILGGISLFALISILYIFGFFPYNFVPSQPTLVGNEWYHFVYYAVLQFGGKFSLLFGLGWALRFIGDLHSKHSQQIVNYNNKIAALDAAEVIITASNSASREKALLLMSETYLNPKDNTFIDNTKTVYKDKENDVNKKDIMDMLKLIVEKFSIDKK